MFPIVLKLYLSKEKLLFKLFKNKHPGLTVNFLLVDNLI